ncbi:MAG: helix-turn-helix transcriptional regulator [Prevotellaceae bacterium]|nr:helix-turn-helix transcriptional regulator [Prevotellaceae bacterium]
MTNKRYTSYQAIILCYQGSCRLSYNEAEHEMRAGCCAILFNMKMLKGVTTSSDCVCKVLYVEEYFLRQSEPRTPYIIQGLLALHTRPVIELGDSEAEQCKALFRNLEQRLENTEHKFYSDVLRTSLHLMLLDIFDFHARISETVDTSLSASSIMAKFIAMLENKEYRENREVAYYAEKLCVVPKYLSEVSNKVSGFSASYWISRYAAQDISEVLRKNERPVSEIAQMFHFTSTSYFNRYVKRTLGVYPSELRAS